MTLIDPLTRAYIAFQTQAQAAGRVVVDGKAYIGIRALVRGTNHAGWKCPAFSAPAGWKWTYSVKEES